MSKKNKLDLNCLNFVSSTKDSKDLKYQKFCCSCQKATFLHSTLSSTSGFKTFCNDLCSNSFQKGFLKKKKVCDWCKHVRHTIKYIDCEINNQRLQFCNDKCLNQYKLNMICKDGHNYTLIDNSFKATQSSSSSDLEAFHFDSTKSHELNTYQIESNLSDHLTNESVMLVNQDSFFNNAFDNSKFSLIYKNSTEIFPEKSLRWSSKVYKPLFQQLDEKNLQVEMMTPNFSPTSNFNVQFSQAISNNRFDKLQLSSNSINYLPPSTTKIEQTLPFFHQNSLNLKPFQSVNILNSFQSSSQSKTELPPATVLTPYSFLIPISIPFLVPVHLKTKLTSLFKKIEVEKKDFNICQLVTSKLKKKNEIKNELKKIGFNQSEPLANKPKFNPANCKRPLHSVSQETNTFQTQSLQNLIQTKVRIDERKCYQSESSLKKRIKK